MAYDFDEMRRGWNGIKSCRAYPYVITAIRAALIFLLYCIGTRFLFAILFSGNSILNADISELSFLHAPTALVSSIFFLNSTLLNFANFDSSERLKFFARYNDKVTRESEKLLIRKDKLLWVEIGVITVLFLCFFSQSAVFSALFILIEQIPFLPAIPKWLRVTVTTAVFFCVLYGLEIYTRLEARKFWLNPVKERGDRKYHWESPEERKKKMFGNGRRIRKLLTSYVIILMGSAVAPASIAIILNFVGVAWAFVRLMAVWAKSLVFWIVLALLFLLIFGLAIRKRFLFLHNLKRTCKTCGFRLLDMKHPFLALFRDLKGYTFCIEANGQIYYCRLIASVKRSNKMIFLPDGTASRRVSFHIPQPALGGVRGFVQMYDRGNGDDREFAYYARHFTYAFECGDGKKILLLNPVPRRAIYEVEGKRSELDNGSVIGEKRDYTVYSGNAFLRLLKRESMKDE